MARENYYILLDLDPKVRDQLSIDDAIKKKKLAWAKLRNHPRQGTKAKQNLDSLPDITRVLGDPILRDAEATQAETIFIKDRAKQEKSLQEDLNFMTAKGYLTKKELKNLQARHTMFGEEDIKKMLPAGVAIEADKKKKGKAKATEPSRMKEIQARLEILGKRDLYDFLGVTSTSSLSSLKNAQDEIDNTNKRAGNKTAEVTATGELVGFCSVIFKNDLERKAYDQALTNQVFDDLANRLNLLSKGDVILVSQFKALITLAGDRGIEHLTAEEWIKDKAQDLGLSLEVSTSLKEQHFNCGRCKRLISITLKNCSHCGFSTEITCPVCNTINRSDTAHCISCATHLGNLSNAELHIADANNHIRHSDIPQAVAAIEKALLAWPGNKDALRLKNDLERKVHALEKLVKEIKSLVKSKHIYQAERQIDQYIGLENSAFSTLKAQVKATLAKAEGEVAKANETKATVDKVKALLAALTIASDCDQALQELKRFPPCVPEDLLIRANKNKIDIRWYDTGEPGITYCLVRKKSSPANTPTEGEVIFEGTDERFQDVTLPKGEVYYYSLFSQRQEVWSDRGVFSRGILVPEVVNLPQAIGLNRSVRLQWTRPKYANNVLIRWSLIQAPRSIKEGENLITTEAENHLHQNIQDGVTYHYSFFSAYTIGTKQIYSDPVSVKAMPSAPPAPVRDLAIVEKENHFDSTWTTPSHGQVILFISSRAPKMNVGDIVSEKELLTWGDRLPAWLPGESKVPKDFQGKRYLLPILQSGHYWVVGSYQILKYVPPLPGIRLHRDGDVILAEWQWPKYSQVLRISYGPKFGNWAQTVKLKVTEGDTKGTWQFPSIIEGWNCLAVKAWLEADGEAGPVFQSKYQLILPKVEGVLSLSNKTNRSGTYHLTLSLRRADEIEDDIVLAYHEKHYPMFLNHPDSHRVLIISPKDFLRNKYKKSFSINLKGKRLSGLYFGLFVDSRTPKVQTVEFKPARFIIYP